MDRLSMSVEEFASVEAYKASIEDFEGVGKVIEEIKNALIDFETRAFVVNGIAFVIEVHAKDIHVYSVDCGAFDEAIIYV
jgi:hypothetical protein